MFPLIYCMLSFPQLSFTPCHFSLRSTRPTGAHSQYGNCCFINDAKATLCVSAPAFTKSWQTGALWGHKRKPKYPSVEPKPWVDSGHVFRNNANHMTKHAERFRKLRRNGKQGGDNGTMGQWDTGKQWETRGHNGREEAKQWKQKVTRPREAGRTIQHRHTYAETMGNSGGQDIRTLGRRPHHPTRGTHVRRQWETSGDKISGTRTHHKTQAYKWRDNGKHWKTRKIGGDQSSGRHKCGETIGHIGRQWNGSMGGKRAHWVTARQPEPMGNEEDNALGGGHTIQGGDAIQHRHTCRKAMEINGRQGEAMGHNVRQWDAMDGHTIQQRETRRGTMGDKGRQDFREGGSTIQKRETGKGTMRERKKNKVAETRTHHPTTGNKKGHHGRQRGETGPLRRRAHHPTKGNQKGHNGRQGSTIPRGRRKHYPAKGSQKGDNGRQWEARPFRNAGKPRLTGIENP